MTSIQDNEKIQNTSNHICLLTIERDTYRDLCAEMVKTLRAAESWLEGWASAESELAQTRSDITRAESILGEKK